MRWLLLLCALAVTHGSLFPWQFQSPASLRGAWWSMLHKGPWWTGGGDVLGNVLLFVPVGVLAWLSFESRPSRPGRRLAFITLSCLVFAFALQVAQIWLPRRSPAVSDVFWNGIGLALGLVLANALREPLQRVLAQRHSRHDKAYGMAALWLVIAWWPLLPLLKRSLLKDTWLQIVDTGSWQFVDLIEPALGMAIVVFLMRGMRWRLFAACALFLVALAGKFVFAQQVSVPGEAWGWLLGLGLGVLAWPLSERAGLRLILCAAVAWFVAHALHPYALSAVASPFHWLPLAAVLQEQKVMHTAALCRDLFWIAAIMLAARKLGFRLGHTLLVVVGGVLALELLQVWLPGQQADITPALLPIPLALLLSRRWPRRARHHG
jgi:hypothetical protein